MLFYIDKYALHICQNFERKKMNKIRTVLGDISSDKIGMTYTHEHIYSRPYTSEMDPTLAITDIDLSIKELINFKNAGGVTLVEGTAIDYGRNPEIMRKASKKSGVNLIATTGYYLHDHNPDNISGISIEELADVFIKDILFGMDSGNIKAGQIKCAVSPLYIHENEEKCLKAAAVAQRKTNAPIWIHHGGIMGMEILDILEENGADLSKVVLGHVDRNPDTFDYKQIAKRGCYMSVDNLVRIYRYPLEENIRILKDLLDMDKLDWIFISADFGRYTYYKAYGGGPGLEYIIKKFIPRFMKECELSEEDIKQIFINNPKAVYGCF